MEKAEIRLECLKLAHAHGREIASVLERAKAYEDYLTGSTTNEVQLELPLEMPKAARVKKSGNASILS